MSDAESTSHAKQETSSLDCQKASYRDAGNSTADSLAKRILNGEWVAAMESAWGTIVGSGPLDSEADASTETVKVIVQNVAGRTLLVELTHRQVIKQLKVKILESWGMPVTCQKLLLGNEMVNDGTSFKELLPQSTALAESDTEIEARTPPLLQFMCMYSQPCWGMNDDGAPLLCWV